MTQKPPLKIYKGPFTILMGEPPDAVYTAEHNEQILLNAQLRQENEQLRKELAALRK